MTILSVAFAISMRIERTAARNFADTVRAKQLIHAALVRAFQDINETMRDPAKNPTPSEMPLIYPDWGSLSRGGTPQPDVMWSYDSTAANAPNSDASHIMNGEAIAVVPGDRGDSMDLKLQADGARPVWITNNIPRGKVSYVVVNTSGLIDVNEASGSNRLYSTHINEIDVSGTPEFIGSLNTFVNDRDTHKRYETLDELSKLNAAISEPVGAVGGVSSFNTFSFDLNRDVFFMKDKVTEPFTGDWWLNIDLDRPVPTIGRRDAEQYLHPKFNLNSITNYLDPNTAGKLDRYTNKKDFEDNYYTPLFNILDHILPDQERPDDVAWNIINYLDEDRIPQRAGSDQPWTHTEGGEPIPMINEIVVREYNIGEQTEMLCMGADDLSNVENIQNPERGSPYYVFSIELWYPYAPVKVSHNDNFSFQLAIFDQEVSTSLGIMDNHAAIQQMKLDVSINDMEFGTDTEFLVFDRTFGFHTNGSPGLVRLADTENGFWFIARVSQQTKFGLIPVDEAIRTSFHITRPRVYQVNDPRSNGQIKYWRFNEEEKVTENLTFSNGMDWDPSRGDSLESMNVTPPQNIRNRGSQPVCDPWSHRGQGLPIYATNGVMRNIGELGHIFRSNLDGEEDAPHLWYWRTLNLMHQDEGAQLLDLLTVRGHSQPSAGLFCINSRQTESIRALFHKLKIGVAGADELLEHDFGRQDVDPNDIGSADENNSVVFELNRTNLTSFTDMFNADSAEDGGGGPLADAFRRCAPSPTRQRHPNQRTANDIYKEDTFRSICELITFRQNIFTIVLGAQSLAPKGDFVVAEKRAVANVYRDAYTGRHFVRSFKWLDD